ncbi:hypothetical protein [Desulfocurvibacter africanus]|uniref:hypothetical protein n=1 Tax=Desulfocurvibacter africanus TaxID=873 RepID=UPI000489A634|nr:hypothetical protein [Desulfocurvibacter africanus]
MRLSLLMIMGLCLSLAGCAPTISNLAEYRAIPLSQADYLPSVEQLKTQKIKIVVFPLSEGATHMAKRSNLGTVTAETIESKLSGGTVEIVDRQSAKKLQQEVMLSEITNQGTYNGPEVADFAISGNIDKATFGYQYTAAYTYRDSQGKTYDYPAAYHFSAIVSGKIKIFQLPSLKVVKTITFTDSVGMSEDAHDRVITGRTGTALVIQAATDAIHSARFELKNFFAKKGYVLEKRAKKNDKAIYKVNLGTEDGLKTGDVCQIYTLSKSVNALTREESTEEFLLGEGKVSNQMGANYSWLVVRDSDLQSPIRLGDYVKAKYSKSLLEVLGLDTTD